MANGLNIPENLYSGGAVTFDSRPSTNLYLQFLRQKQAKEEALDNYERARMDRINETGLRDQDREGLDNRVLGLKQFYQGNKDAIRRGNTPQAYEYEKMMREVKGFINMSKANTAKGDALMMKIRPERLKQGRSMPPEFIEEYTTHELPLDDPNYKEIDIAKYTPTDAKYDAIKALKGYAHIKRTPQTPRYEAIPGDRFNRNKFIDEKFDDEAKDTIATLAAEEFDRDDGFANEVQRDYSNPVKRAQLEQLFTEEFKTSPQSMSDYAVAKRLNELQPTITNKPTKEADWQAQRDYTDQQMRSRIRLSKSLGGGDKTVVLADYDILGDYEGIAETMELDVPSGTQGFTQKKSMTIIPANKIDVKDRELFKDVAPMTDARGNKFYVLRPDGNWEGKGSQVIYREKVAQSNLDRTAANEVQRGRTKLKANPTGSNKPPTRPSLDSFIKKQ